MEKIGKEFSGRWLLRNVNAQCDPGERIGLIGANGTGKSTLFQILLRTLSPDEGRLLFANRLEVSVVEQLIQFTGDKTVRQEALQVFEHFRKMEQKLAVLESRMAESEDRLPANQAEEYETLRLQLRLQGGYDYQARTESVLYGLGFQSEDLSRPCHQLSGGQQRRLLLAKCLLRPAQLLLLDEPTNHLDLSGILFLSEYLRNTSSALVVISHDRHFLDSVTNRTWELEGGTLVDYPVPYQRSRELRRRRRRQQEQEFRRQQEWKAETEDFIRRNLAGQKTKQAQSRRKRLEKTDWITEPVPETPVMNLQFPECRRGGAVAFEISGGEVGYPGKSLLCNVDFRLERGARVAILGSNGSGKTTLLQTILGEIPLLDGCLRWGPNNRIAYYSQAPGFEAGDATVYDVISGFDSQSTEQEIREFAARFRFRGDDLKKNVSSLSGGEQSRLALARFFFKPANVLILDEPTNHLDIPSREALEQALLQFPGAVLMVSHDLFFLSRFPCSYYLIRDSRLWQFSTLEDLEQSLKAPANQAEKGEKAVPATENKSPLPPPELSKNERQRLETRVRELESEIERLEHRQQELLQRLQQNSDDFSKLEQLSNSYQEVEGQLEQLYRNWEESAARLGASG